MKGISTGQPEYDKRKAQKRWLDRERHNIHNDFSADLKPTPEQIEKKRKRDELDAKIKARLDKKAEKRRKGRPKFDFECKHCGFKTKHRNVALAHVRTFPCKHLLPDAERKSKKEEMTKEESLSDKLSDEKVKASLVNMEETGLIKCEDGSYTVSRQFLAMMRKHGLDDEDIEFWNTDNGIINLAKWWTIIRER